MPANATGTYLYFAVDPTFKWNCASNLGVEVEYYDGSLGSFSLKYDGRQGAYQSTTTTLLRRSQRWQQATFKLRDIRFENLENGGADFRLWVRGGTTLRAASGDPGRSGDFEVSSLNVEGEVIL